MIGQTVSHYRIIEKLGEGGMGVVYKAHDTKLDRDVAIKFLPRHITASTVDRERFTIEARAAARIESPEHRDDLFHRRGGRRDVLRHGVHRWTGTEESDSVCAVLGGGSG